MVLLMLVFLGLQNEPMQDRISRLKERACEFYSLIIRRKYKKARKLGLQNESLKYLKILHLSRIEITSIIILDSRAIVNFTANGRYRMLLKIQDYETSHFFFEKDGVWFFDWPDDQYRKERPADTYKENVNIVIDKKGRVVRHE